MVSIVAIEETEGRKKGKKKEKTIGVIHKIYPAFVCMHVPMHTQRLPVSFINDTYSEVSLAIISKIMNIFFGPHFPLSLHPEKHPQKSILRSSRPYIRRENRKIPLREKQEQKVL